MKTGPSPVWRAAVIGCGRIGSSFSDAAGGGAVLSHAQAYSLCPETKLVGVCDADAGKAQECARRWQVEAAYASVEQLLAEAKPQIVSICTPDTTHGEVARQVLACPSVAAVLLEKPIALSLKEAKEIVALARERGLKLAVNYSRRFAASHQRLRQWIQSGGLGRIQAIKGAYTKGVIHNGTHWFDLIRFLAGEVKSVQARNVLGENSADPTLDCWLELENGCSAFLHGCDAESFAVFESELIGTRGRVRTADSGRSFEFFEVTDDPQYAGFKALRPTTGFPGGLDDALPNSVSDLIGALRENREPICNGDDGLAALRVALAARESSVTGQAVRLDKLNESN